MGMRPIQGVSVEGGSQPIRSYLSLFSLLSTSLPPSYRPSPSVIGAAAMDDLVSDLLEGQSLVHCACTRLAAVKEAFSYSFPSCVGWGNRLGRGERGGGGPCTSASGGGLGCVCAGGAGGGGEGGSFSACSWQLPLAPWAIRLLTATTVLPSQQAHSSALPAANTTASQGGLPPGVCALEVLWQLTRNVNRRFVHCAAQKQQEHQREEEEDADGDARMGVQ